MSEKVGAIKEQFTRQEQEDRKQFENFAQRNKDNPFMSNLLIFRMRFYNYKEMLKLFAINFRNEKFSGTRNCMYAFLVAPSMVALTFNIVNPFSIFRSIAIFGVFGGCFGSFLFNLKDELSVIAMKDKSMLGDKVRYRYQ